MFSFDRKIAVLRHLIHQPRQPIILQDCLKSLKVTDRDLYRDRLLILIEDVIFTQCKHRNGAVTLCSFYSNAGGDIAKSKQSTDQQFQIQQFLGPQLVTTVQNHPRMELRYGCKVPSGLGLGVIATAFCRMRLPVVLSPEGTFGVSPQFHSRAGGRCSL
jgi:hypothetical protein